MRAKNSKPRKLWGVLRVAISLLLLIWALTRVGLREVQAHSLGANFGLIGLALLLFNIGLLVRTARWAILLQGYGLAVDFRALLLLNYGGSFFNTFLPTGFGGDFVRMAESSGVWQENRHVAVGVVLLDRFSGLSALFLLCLTSLLFSSNLLAAALHRTLLWVAGAGLVATLALVLAKPALSRFHPHFQKLLGEERTTAFQQVVGRFSIPHFFISILVSLGFHLLIILVHFTLSRALAADIPLILFGVFTPIVSLTLLMPSIQGLGLRESLYGFLVAGIGRPESLGVSIGLLVYGITVATGLLGGVIYLLYGIQKVAGAYSLGHKGQTQ